MNIAPTRGDTPSTGAVAARFTARHEEIVDRYRERLMGIGSPLARDQGAWEQCRTHAADALASCSATLRHGTSITADLGTGSARDRDLLGIHVCHWVRAGALLFEAAVPVLMEEVNRERGCLPMLGPTLDSLHAAIGHRLSEGVEGYDAVLLSQLREVHGETHRKLARALHDEVGNGLSLAMRQLELLEVNSDHGEEERCLRIASAKAALADSLLQMRDVITDLRKPATTASLETGLKAYARSMVHPGVDTVVRVAGDEDHAPPGLLDEVFLVLREALRNAFTHAEPSRVDAEVTVQADMIRACVVDDGIGFDPDLAAATGSTNGLLGMRERVQAMGGSFQVASRSGAGTRVTLSVPIGADDVR